MSIIVGIDPGQSGGIAVLRPYADAEAFKMPETKRDLWLAICTLEDSEHDVVVFLEKVGAGPKMGSSAAFKFGNGFGSLEMAVIASGFRMELVTPQKWQRAAGLIVKGRGLGQDDTSKKNRNKERAQQLFPHLKITHALADALLIAEYGRSQMALRGGSLKRS